MWGNFPQAYSHVGLIHAAFAAAPRWGEYGFVATAQRVPITLESQPAEETPCARSRTPWTTLSPCSLASAAAAGPARQCVDQSETLVGQRAGVAAQPLKKVRDAEPDYPTRQGSSQGARQHLDRRGAGRHDRHGPRGVDDPAIELRAGLAGVRSRHPRRHPQVELRAGPRRRRGRAGLRHRLGPHPLELTSVADRAACAASIANAVWICAGVPFPSIVIGPCDSRPPQRPEIGAEVVAGHARHRPFRLLRRSRPARAGRAPRPRRPARRSITAM